MGYENALLVVVQILDRIMTGEEIRQQEIWHGRVYD
jgi:hypothetical protein